MEPPRKEQGLLLRFNPRILLWENVYFDTTDRHRTALGLALLVATP
jgi:hypothetical protein